jgi:serine protease Do
VGRRAICLAAACAVAGVSLASPSWAQGPCDPVDIAPDDSVSGSLASGDCMISDLPGSDPTDDSFVDVYRVTLGADGFLTVSMNSSSFDTFLFVWDETFTTLIGSDDDGGGGTNSLLSAVPISAGTYVILANSFGIGETGPYTLTTSFFSEGNPACDFQVVLPPSAVADGTLSVDDCTLAQLGVDPTDGSFVDQYRVGLPAGGLLTIRLESVDFDPFLWVFDETLANEIAVNDDANPPEDLNSFLALDLAPGTYVILANAVFVGDTGAYTLTLVPEPATALLWLGALGALGMLARARLQRRRCTRH